MIEKTMIERLAEKLWETNAPELAPDYDSLDADDQAKVQIIVEGLLSAMMEPTDSMIAVGSTAGLSVKGIWQAMLGCVLED